MLLVLLYKRVQKKSLRAILLMMTVFLFSNSEQLRAERTFLNDKVQENTSKKQKNEEYGVSFCNNTILYSQIGVFSNIHLQNNLLGEEGIQLKSQHSLHIYAHNASINSLILANRTKVTFKGKLHIRKNLSLNYLSTLFVLQGSELILEKNAQLRLATGAKLIDLNLPYLTRSESDLPQVWNSIPVFPCDYGTLISQFPITSRIEFNDTKSINFNACYASVVSEIASPPPKNEPIFSSL